MTKSVYDQFSTKRIVMIALFTALIMVGAFIRIDTPVMSFTLQFLFVIAAGMILGKRDAVISVCTYIVMGLIGLPVFARGGGIAYVMQPSFGYILAFILAAYVCGRMTEKCPGNGKNQFLRLFMASLVALVIVYVIGALYYWLMSTFYLGVNIGIRRLLLYCVLLILPGDIFSCLAASMVAKRLNRGTVLFVKKT